MERIDEMIGKLRDGLPLEIREKWAEEERKRAKLAEDFRKACADCLGNMASAIHSPSISRGYMESAHRNLLRALSIASVLDPE